MVLLDFIKKYEFDFGISIRSPVVRGGQYAAR